MLAAGIFHCPSCFGPRPFYVAEDQAPNDGAPDLECEQCGYVWHKARREVVVEGGPGRAVGQVQSVQLIGPLERAKARDRVLSDLKERATAGGVRLENWTHARP